MRSLLVTCYLLMFSVGAWAQKAPQSVVVTNPVLAVEVSNADPVFVRDADNAARSPVWIRLATGKYTVPAGKVLVIEFVSGTGVVTGLGALATATLMAARPVPGSTVPSIATHDLPVQFVGESTSIGKSYSFAHMTRVYVDEGSEVSQSYSYIGSPSFAGVAMTFSGYLVNK